MTRCLVSLCALIVTLASGVAAQGLAVRAGSRVRLWGAAWGPVPIVATVLAAESDTLVVKPDGQGAGLVVPWSNVEKVDLGHWRDYALEGALVGVLAGVLAAAMAGPCEPYDEGDCVGLRVSVLSGLGLMAGAAFGASVRTEIWKPAPRDHVSIGVFVKSTAIGVSLSF